VTPEERRRVAQARVRRELLDEGLTEAQLEELPPDVHPIGEVLDDIVSDLAASRDPLEREK